jgi:signal transduction histidine kinase
VTIGLSQADLSLIAGLARKLAGAPATELIAAEIHQTLQNISHSSEVRVVAAQQPSGWREWIAGPSVAGVRDCEEFPQPPVQGTVAFFDADNPDSGFLWMSAAEEKCVSALQLIAPHAGTAIMLNAALKRSRNATNQDRELARETLRSRDEERRRIAWELHDDLGQSLASLKLSLKWVEDMIRARGLMDEAVSELGAAREAVRTILGKVRDLSRTLYPSILDTLGFAAAIKELLYQSTRHAGIEASCRTTGSEAPLPKEVAVGLYRCCQEAVNNSVRHSGASRITVDIVYESAEVHVTVEDNGKGFDPGSLHEAEGRMMSSGFWTIRQRVADLGGAFRVSTALGNGAAVEITVPTNLRVFDARSKNKAANR